MTRTLLMANPGDGDPRADAEPVIVDTHGGSVVLELHDGRRIEMDRIELHVATGEGEQFATSGDAKHNAEEVR